MRVKLYGEGGNYLGTATLGDKESATPPHVIHNRGRYFLRQGQTDVYREFSQDSVIDFAFDTQDFAESAGIDKNRNLDDDKPQKMGTNKNPDSSKLVVNPKPKEEEPKEPPASTTPKSETTPERNPRNRR